MEAWHLTKRFFGSLRATDPTPSEEEWLIALLTEAEEQLYRAQDSVDRRHSIECALRIRDALGPHATGPIVVASALHDVGKAGTVLGTFGRAVATVVGKVLPRATIDSWSSGDAWRGRVGTYLRHDERGAQMLARAGSHPTVVAWAGEHHDRSLWTIEAATAEALLAADHS
jgi:hypothetical protein